jgi:hypothetical protein
MAMFDRRRSAGALLLIQRAAGCQLAVRARSDRRTKLGLLTFSSDLLPPFVRLAEFDPLQVGQKSDDVEAWDTMLEGGTPGR